MPLFSKVKGAKKPADENKQHSPGKAPLATEPKPASYHHKPTHAATDALGSTPVSCQEADWERIRKEHRAHAQHQMSSALVQSPLSTSSANTSTADSSVVTPASSTSKSSTFPQRIDFPPQPSTERIYFSHKNPTAQPAKTDATPRMTPDPSPRHSEHSSIASEKPSLQLSLPPIFDNQDWFETMPQSSTRVVDEASPPSPPPEEAPQQNDEEQGQPSNRPSRTGFVQPAEKRCSS